MKIRTMIFRAIAGVLAMAGSASPQEIRIGVAEALTGNAAQYGLPIRKGLELAAAEINAAGGINGNQSDNSTPQAGALYVWETTP